MRLPNDDRRGVETRGQNNNSYGTHLGSIGRVLRMKAATWFTPICLLWSAKESSSIRAKRGPVALNTMVIESLKQAGSPTILISRWLGSVH